MPTAEHILRAATDGIFSLDREGRITFINPAASRMFGWAPEELLGKVMHHECHHHREDGSAYPLNECPVTGTWTTGMPHVAVRDVYWRKNGEPFHVEYTSSPLFDDAGELAGAVLVFHDETESQRNRSALQRSELQHREMFEKSPYPMWVYDRRTLEFLSVNDAAVRKYGYSREEFQRMTIRDIRPAEDVAKLERHVAQLSDSVDSFGIWRHCTKGGETIEVEVTAHAQKFNGRDAELVLAIDVTQRMRSERQIRQLSSELAKRLAELNVTNKELEAFSYSVSHDLRAPLRHIAGFSRILHEKLKSQLDDDSKRHFEFIINGVHNMGTLIDDLLSLARLAREPIVPTRVSVADLVESARVDLSEELQHRNVEWRIAEMPIVEGDPRLLKQVVLNLLSNALKFSRSRERAVIEIGAAPGTAETVFHIKDNGVGFDMKYAGNLFLPFNRLHRQDQYEGTGIGTAIMKRIIEKHGGRIWVEAEEDKGAAFYFTLPRSASNVTSQEKAE